MEKEQEPKTIKDKDSSDTSVANDKLKNQEELKSETAEIEE